MKDKQIYDCAKYIFDIMKQKYPEHSDWWYLIDDIKVESYYNDFEKILLNCLKTKWQNISRKDLDEVATCFNEIARNEKFSLHFPKKLYESIDYLDRIFLEEEGVNDLCRFIAFSLNDKNNTSRDEQILDVNEKLLSLSFDSEPNPFKEVNVNDGKDEALIRGINEKVSLSQYEITLVNENEIKKYFLEKELKYINWIASIDEFEECPEDKFDSVLLINPFLCNYEMNINDDRTEYTVEGIRDYIPLKETIQRYEKILKKDGRLFLVVNFPKVNNELLQNVHNEAYRTGLFMSTVVKFYYIKKETDINGVISTHNQFKFALIILVKSQNEPNNIKFLNIDNLLTDEYIEKLIKFKDNQEIKGRVAFIPQNTKFTAADDLTVDEMGKYYKNKFSRNESELLLKDVLEPVAFDLYDIQDNGIIRDIERIDNIDSNIVFIPKSRRVFEVVGICFSINELYQKIFNSNLRYQDLLTDEVINKLGYFGLVINNCKRNNSYNLKKFLVAYVNDDWKRVVKDDSYYYDRYLDTKMDVLYWFFTTLGFEWNNLPHVEGMSDGEICVLLKKTIIYYNTETFRLDRREIDFSYFKLFLKSNNGKNLILHWQQQIINNDVIKVLETLKILMPPLSEQYKVSAAHEAWEKEASKCHANLDRIINYIDYKDDNFAYPSVNTSYLESLPQPLSSLIYLTECEISTTRKIDNILKFFEATAEFHATILLSLVDSYLPGNNYVKNLVERVFKSKLRNQKTAYHMDFGLWTDLIYWLVNSTEVLKSPPKGTEKEKLEVEKCLEVVFPKDQNRMLSDILHTVEEVRNTIRHGPRNTEVITNQIYDNCYKYLLSIEKVLIKLYHNVHLLYFERAEISEPDSLTGYYVSGVFPRLRVYKNNYRSFLQAKENELNLLYSTADSEVKVVYCTILPFLVYGPLTVNDKKLKSMFYLSSIDFAGENSNIKLKYNSYDAGEERYQTVNIRRKNMDNQGDLGNTGERLIDFLNNCGLTFDKKSSKNY